MSSNAMNQWYKMTQATLAKEECQCEHHTLLHPVSGVYPPCAYGELQEIVTNSKGDNNFTLQKQPEPDKIVLIEDNGWFIEKNTDPGAGVETTPHESWIGHYCPALFWKVYLDEKAMMKYGVCIRCMTEVPPGLIALWKMHNWDYLQTGHTYDLDNPYRRPGDSDACGA